MAAGPTVPAFPAPAPPGAVMAPEVVAAMEAASRGSVDIGELQDAASQRIAQATGAAIIELMHRVQAESRTTFIFSTHDAKVMAHATTIVRLADGNVAETNGKPGQPAQAAAAGVH